MQLTTWDWVQNRQLQVISGFGQSILGTALLSDGRLAVVGGDGNIRIGDLGNWDAHTVVPNESRLCGVVAAQHGCFITADGAGHINVWRDGKCALTFLGGHSGTYSGVPLGIVGRRVVAVGKGNNLIVIE